jgi:hypothetical protein
MDDDHALGRFTSKFGFPKRITNRPIADGAHINSSNCFKLSINGGNWSEGLERIRISMDHISPDLISMNWI